MKRLVVWVSLMFFPAAFAEQASPVGVWEIIELVNYSPTGEASRPFGADPRGYFVYTPAGNLILHININPGLSLQSSPPSMEELALRARSSIAYFGTYTADLQTGVITHEIVGDLHPNRIGSKQARPYTIVGDQLELDFTSEDGRRYVRRLKRIESFR